MGGFGLQRQFGRVIRPVMPWESPLAFWRNAERKRAIAQITSKAPAATCRPLIHAIASMSWLDGPTPAKILRAMLTGLLAKTHALADTSGPGSRNPGKPLAATKGTINQPTHQEIAALAANRGARCTRRNPHGQRDHEETRRQQSAVRQQNQWEIDTSQRVEQEHDRQADGKIRGEEREAGDKFSQHDLGVVQPRGKQKVKRPAVFFIGDRKRGPRGEDGENQA